MCRIKDNTKRELLQLWYVAEYYMNSAKSLYNKDSLSITVKDFSAKCKSLLDIEKNSEVILCVAHFSSAAARLCSIDENLKKFHDAGIEISSSPRKPGYDKVHNEIMDILKGKRQNEGDTGSAIKKIREILNKTAHFVLRNRSAHAEYPHEEEVYGVLTLEELYNSMRNVIQLVENDLQHIGVL